jgi:hypothetical protein
MRIPPFGFAKPLIHLNTESLAALGVPLSLVHALSDLVNKGAAE